MLRQEDPLGLFRRDTELAAARTVEVHPAVTPVAVRNLARGPVDSGDGQRAGASLDADFFTLRAYDHGDDPRHIHWLSSARSGQLMVRRSAEPVLTRLTLVLDLDASSYADGMLFEEAVDVTASLLVAVVRQGATARLWTVAGDAPSYEAEFGTGVRILSELSRVEAVTEADTRPAEPARRGGRPRVAVP